MSENFREQFHTFSGTSAQKLAATAVYFLSLPNIDFLPKEILTEFPLLNAIMIHNCLTFTTIKNDFFTNNFSSLQYLWLPGNKIATIEANAFQYLVKLRWIRLYGNQIQSLSFQIFQNNPELFYIDLQNNKINAIDLKFFKSLKKLNFVRLTGSNLCISKDFGCASGSCLVTQEDLDKDLATCHSNCLKDLECALTSGKFDLLNPSYVEENIDSIVSNGHLDVLVKMNYTDSLIKKNHLDLIIENGFLDLLVAQNYLDLLIQNGHLDLLIEKNYTELLVENGYKNKIIEGDWRLKLIYKDPEAVKNEANLLQEISQNSKEIKTVDKKFEEISAMFGSDLKVQQDKVGLLKKEVADLKERLNNCEADKQSNKLVQGIEEKPLKITDSLEGNQWLAQGKEKFKEELKELTQVLSLQVSEAKLLMENERLKFELHEAKHINYKQATDFELKTLKQELTDLKRESERREAEMKALKDQVDKFEMSSRP
jgi:hypothetical protein